MRMKYFSDTDTAIIEFTNKVVNETKEISFQIFGFWSDNIQHHMINGTTHYLVKAATRIEDIQCYLKLLLS